MANIIFSGWINSASGSFTLKAEWAGDSVNAAVSNTTTLSFLPYQNTVLFTIQSNSTVTALTFNNETSTLSFTVLGPSGTTGFVKATIAKRLLANGEELQVSVDGRRFNYSFTSTTDSWIYLFSYSHSTHQISMHLTDNASLTQSIGNELILVAIIAVLGVVVAVEVYSFRTKMKRKN